MVSTEFEQIVDAFTFFETWEDRYSYILELAAMLPPFKENERTPENKVDGCVSNVWIITSILEKEGKKIFVFNGDSDSHIVKGIIAILYALLSGQNLDELINTDIMKTLTRLQLDGHLTSQRTNGLRSMVDRLQRLINS
jgi:cysteine desulfuration protein SufE